MKGSRFTEEQIIGILREQEAGSKTAEAACWVISTRRHGSLMSSPASPIIRCSCLKSCYRGIGRNKSHERRIPDRLIMAAISHYFTFCWKKSLLHL